MRKTVRVYLAKSKPAIVAPMYQNIAGIYYEQETPITVEAWPEGEGLVDALRLALERFSVRDRNLRDAKKSDWPSYLASRCRSVKDFEKSYLCVGVSPFNDAELLYDASAEPAGEAEIVLHVTLNRYSATDEIKRKILRLFDACLMWDSKMNQETDSDGSRPCA